MRLMLLPDEIAETTIALKDQFFDLRGLSAYSSMGVSTLRDHIRVDLPCFKVGGKILVKKSEFDAWMLEKHRHKPELSSIVDDVMESLRG